MGRRSHLADLRLVKFFNTFSVIVRSGEMVPFLFFVVLFCDVNAGIPSYIKICKRNDPDLAGCIINSIEYLRPQLKNGIPELNVPAIEPLPLQEIKIRSGPNQAQINANITNLLVHGPSTFKILNLQPDLSKTRFLVQFVIPLLNFEGDYDIDMNVLILKYKGKGPITGKFINYKFTCLLKADKVKANGKTYLKFRKFTLTLQTGKSEIKLGNLFGENGAALNEATNELVTNNADLFIDEIKPALEDSIAETFTNIANSIVERFSFEELFPES